MEFANQLQLQGLPKLDAVRQAAMTWLRPILMTSAATIAGHFPLTLVTSTGAAGGGSRDLTPSAVVKNGTPLFNFGRSGQVRICNVLKLRLQMLARISL